MEQVLNAISPQIPISQENFHKEQLKNRVDSYDVARAVAVIGMVAVNFNVIFVHGGNRMDCGLAVIAAFLTGRAAALFVMLAGVGIGLMAQKAFSENDYVKIQQIRYSLLKRSFFLLIAGFFFMQIWGSDILHFYAVYLVLAAWILHCRVSVLMRLVTLNTLLFFALYFLMKGEVELPSIQGANWAVEAIDDYFFSGLYAVLPWSTFMLIGILLVRSGLLYDRLRLIKTFTWAVIVFSVVACLQRGVAWYLGIVPEGELSSYIEPLLMSDCFPITPIFLVSSLATSIMVIAALVILAKARMLQNVYSVLKDTGRFSLTIYVGHIIFAKGLHLAAQKFLPEHYYNSAFQLSVYATLIVIICCSRYWARCYRYGPLELLMRRLTSSM